MNKILSFVCAIFFLHSSCAVPAPRANPYLPYVRDLFTSADLTPSIMGIQGVVFQKVSAAETNLEDTATNTVAWINTYVPEAVAGLETLVNTVNSNVNNLIETSTTLSAETSAVIQSESQAAVTKALDLIHSYSDMLTMGIGQISAEITSDAQYAADRVTVSVKAYTQHQLPILSKTSTSRTVTDLLNTMVATMNTGLNGVATCISSEASNIKTNVDDVVNSFNGEVPIIYQYASSCLALTSDSDIAACYQVSLKP